ncbi:hypothetical protein BN874_610013 [Candidatus Contendobacter odensis Run_B_J11]|uniref:Uncharacterized protein n=1 Tax=Candidatus Contendobacter odensis Run_B_J11 TaxID=1400861 RepID=A0A7U7J5U3_9GAMM|nr:hypothetical protein BN874_610013 [Candidatus Contendobacter odensis Run_B_J11]
MAYRFLMRGLRVRGAYPTLEIMNDGRVRGAHPTGKYGGLPAVLSPPLPATGRLATAILGTCDSRSTGFRRSL